MQYVPVVSASGKPLMPCHPARARELVHNDMANRRFNRGVFYIRLTKRSDGATQPIAVGIDPGSKKEGLTVKSAAHTYLNIQADAVTWVSYAVQTRRMMRRGRRGRKTPYRKCRWNRKIGGIPPSTKARWQWKLRLAWWLVKMYPITHFVVEDIKATTKRGKRRWNRSFSPLEVGKQWFYKELNKVAPVETRQGYETKELRDAVGLKKSSNKLAETFDAHCVDSWVLANWWVGGHIRPDNEAMLFVTPLQFHRRQLHWLQPERGGLRRRYGGTRSLGFKRGSLVKHPKYGVVFVGGFLKDRISLHSLTDGKRLTQKAKPSDCKFLTYNSWRTHSSAT
jgi:RRXRR protein